MNRKVSASSCRLAYTSLETTDWSEAYISGLILTGRCRVHEDVIIIIIIFTGVPADARYLLGVEDMLLQIGTAGCRCKSFAIDIAL